MTCSRVSMLHGNLQRGGGDVYHSNQVESEELKVVIRYGEVELREVDVEVVRGSSCS